jgi:hypothetical protein
LLKSILEDAGIYTILTQACLVSLNNLPTRGTAAKVLLTLEDREQAMANVDEFYANMQKQNPEE